MKKIIIMLSLAAFTIATSFAQSEKYTAAMKKKLENMEAANADPAKMLELGNSFERIAEAEKGQWLPYYYAALTQINYGFMHTEAKNADPIADKADELISKADAISPNNSEITVLKTLAATLHMIVNPMQRYMKYGPIISKFTAEAKEEDPNNPRPYMIEGQSLKSTPEQFGGGCKTAMPILQIAVEKYSTSESKDPLAPHWGADEAKKLLESCN